MVYYSYVMTISTSLITEQNKIILINLNPTFKSSTNFLLDNRIHVFNTHDSLIYGMIYKKTHTFINHKKLFATVSGLNHFKIHLSTFCETEN